MKLWLFHKSEAQSHSIISLDRVNEVKIEVINVTGTSFGIFTAEKISGQ